MDSRLNSIKDRIRALINRNKQIDTELENNSQESKKEVLNTEKEQNNNELRKQRTQKYEIQQISEDLDYIKKCYLYLRKLGIIKSQHQFSREFLNKSQEYSSLRNTRIGICGLNTPRRWGFVPVNNRCGFCESVGYAHS